MATTEQRGEEQSDAVLVSRMAAGDERALGQLYDRHGRLAYGLALAITRTASAAESAVAQAFSELWANARRYRDDGLAFRVLVAKVVRRQALSFRIDETSEGVAERVIERRIAREGVGKRRGSGPNSPAEQVRDSVLGVLEGLPAVQRRVLDLAYFGGLSVREIATEINATEEDVTSYLRLSMDALRRSPAVVAVFSSDPAIVHA